MTSFARKYSDEQLDALFSAVLDEGQSIRSTMKRAGAGELDPLTPEEARELATMPYAYACQLVKAQRGERAAAVLTSTDPDPTIRILVARMVLVADREVRLLEREAKKGPANLDRMARCAKLLRELRALCRDEQKAKANGNGQAPEQNGGPTSFAARIAAGQTPSTDHDETDNV